MDSPDCLLILRPEHFRFFLLFTFSVFHFLVVCSVLWVKPTHVGF